MSTEELTLEQQIQLYKNMVKLYKFDHLTNLKMRRDFEIETRHKLQSGQSFVMAFYDVNGLHEVNRSKSYADGDALIRQVATDISLAPGLWELYRIGGDEFVAIYFTGMTPIEVANATMGAVSSNSYSCVSQMLDATDKLVVKQKQLLSRRLDDRNSV